MWKYNGGGNQKFTVTKNSDGTYTIVNCLSGKALDASGGKSSAGTNIIQYSKNGGKNQKWKVSYSNGGFVFTSAANSNVVLGSSAVSNGSNVSLVTANSSSKTQRYTLEKTTYTPPMPADKQAMYNKAQGYSSNTGYLFLVDRKTHKVGVFKGSKGNWSYVYYWSCVTGAASSPTITGTYKTTGLKKTVLSTDSRARWCTQINGGYFFHTILASESELGRSASHGCIRLAVSNAKWIYNNIGKGTTVVIYN
jgi:lipoprotein-anchoring transpeptidase ErfK/SrfK